MIAAALSRFMPGGGDLATVAPRLLDGLPDAYREAATVLRDVGEYSDSIGPAEPPQIFEALFDQAAKAHDLPSLLLAAVAAVLSDFRADLNTAGRIGLMGLPRFIAGGERQTATVDELISAEPAAVEAVRNNVELAARVLVAGKQAFEGKGGTAAAVYHYCREAPGPREGEARDAAAMIIATYTLYLVRSARADARESATAELEG